MIYCIVFDWMESFLPSLKAELQIQEQSVPNISKDYPADWDNLVIKNS